MWPAVDPRLAWVEKMWAEEKGENSDRQQLTNASVPPHPTPCQKLTPTMMVSLLIKAITEKNLDFYLSCMLEMYRL